MKFKYEKAVYHNPYAKKPLPPDLFKDVSVRQLIPIERDDEYIMKWV